MDIWTATKAGDFARVKYLVEVTDCDINKKNEFDAIPLFYACLCGHSHIVNYLLSKGAVLDSNTFEAERCFYAAHDKEIVDILRDFKAKPKPINMLAECLRTCLLSSKFPDITFVIHNQEVSVHKYILSERSNYFKTMFSGVWKDRRYIRFNHPLINPESFKCLMHYIYTNTLNLEYDLLQSFLLLCKQCKLPELASKVNYEAINRNVSDRIILNNNEDEEYLLPKDMKSILDNVQFTDIEICVENDVYRVHKDILICRSEYFSSLMTGKFKESSNKVVMNDLESYIFELVLEFIYTNSVETIEDCNIALNLLRAAEQYLLTDLKRICINYLVKKIDLDNIYDLFYAADLFNSYKLAEACRDFVAENFDILWESQEFKKFISSSSEDFRNRVKDNIEGHFCHYGYKYKWEKIEIMWDDEFNKNT